MNQRYFTPTGLNLTGKYGQIDYSEYIEQIQTDLAKARSFYPGGHNESTQLNTPFESVPSEGTDTAVLLIHGLLETPFITRDIAGVFEQQGFAVRSVLLPGHATVPADLLYVDYEAWIRAVKYALQGLLDKYDNVYIAGLSTGALLAIDAALSNEDIRGLFLIAPANKIKTPFAFMGNWHKAVSWAIPRLKWLTRFAENDIVKYKSTTMNAGYQVYRLGKYINHRLKTRSLNCPIWMAVPEEDETISAYAAIDFFNAQTHPDNQLLLFTRSHAHCKTHNIQCASCTVPEDNIIGLSHVGIGVSPDNPHYGKEGMYTQYCRKHITSPHPRFGAINDAKKLWTDFKTRFKTPAHGLYRLHYNPHFDVLVKSLKKTLDCWAPPHSKGLLNK